MSESIDQRFAPPQAHVEDLAPAQGSLELAGRGIRLVAAIIDTLLIMLLAWLVMLIPFFAAVLGKDSAGLMSWTTVGMLIGLVGFLIIQGPMLVKSGQTIGKKIMGIRIVRTDGSKADAFRVLGLRYGIGFVISFIPILSTIYGLVDSLAIFRESRQCVHDLFADTKVVKA